MKFPYTDEELEQIQRESAARAAREPHAEDARNDAASGRLEINLCGGSTVSVPARKLRGLADASDAQLAEVRVADGRALFWDDLVVQMTLLAVLNDCFGIQSRRSAGTCAGTQTARKRSATSRARKAVPARKEPTASG